MLLRAVALIVVAAGVLVLLVSCGMDTSVAAVGGGRVANIQRIAHQASYERWGFGLVVVGLVLWIAGRGSASAQAPAQKPDPHRYPPSW